MLYGCPAGPWSRLRGRRDRLFDGLLARRSGPTTLGAWLDPMADKLLLTTMFVMLTMPSVATVAAAAAVADRPGHQPRHRDRPDRRDRQSRGRAPDVPAVVPRQGDHGDLHGHRRRHALRELHRRAALRRHTARIRLARSDAGLCARGTRCGSTYAKQALEWAPRLLLRNTQILPPLFPFSERDLHG